LTLDFFFMNGDANRDRRVNLQDFNVLASRFGQAIAPGVVGRGSDEVDRGDDRPLDDLFA